MRLEIPEPNEKQALFLADQHKVIAYGGARGGGKSWAVRVKAVLLCLAYPGIKVMIVRKTYPELQENHIQPLTELLRCYAGRDERIASYNDQKKTISFPNRSRILFRYCRNEQDAQRFQGTEVDVLFVDEATQQSEERMDKLRACVRGVNSFPKRIYYTCNPGGEGHAWVKRLFIDKVYKGAERAEDYSFIRALVTDNTALLREDPDYLQRLDSLPHRLREAWRYGKWDVFEGQFFEELCLEPDTTAAKEAGFEPDAEQLRREHRFTHVIPAIDLSRGPQRSWKIYRSYDWGYNKPFSCAWWAVDYDDVLYRILELYGCVPGSPNEGVRWDNDRQFRRIAEIEREHPWLRGKEIHGVADPSIWNGNGGPSIADMAMKHHVYFQPGDNERIPGWMQVHYRLQFDENGYSRMYVFDNCRDFIRTMPLLLYDPHKPEDLNTEMEDHIADETRYMCMARPVAPIREKPAPERLSDPLDMLR